MKKITTLFDNEIKVDYDLYLINAKKLKSLIINSYKLTDGKYRLFNGDTRLKQCIERVYNNDNIQIDLKNGTVEKSDSSTKEIDTWEKDVINGMNNPLNLSDSMNKSHLMGYELMPLAISVPDRDVVNNKNVELLDGFRRMFYVNEVPNHDVLVKVYDTLDNVEWANAMLLFNSWKIAMGNGFSSFVDRGFKLSLYKHFDIDVSLYSDSSLNALSNYFDGYFYERLKNNPVFIDDLKLILDIQEEYVQRMGNAGKNKDRSLLKHIDILLSDVYALIGYLRHMEFFDDYPCAKVITVDMFKEFLHSEEMMIHIKKIDGMSTPGHIKNYVSKNVKPIYFNWIREMYELKPLTKAVYEDLIKYCSSYSHDVPSGVILKNLDEITKLINTKKERIEALKNKPMIF